MFSSAKELQDRLETAGLPEHDIDRVIQRLEFDYPTFGEISNAVADNLKLINRSGGAINDVRAEISNTVRQLACHTKVSAILDLSLV
jgi:hypothetical protein